MISFDKAINCVRIEARPLGTETVSIEVASGRILATPVVARIASPRRDASAMDGYAVREADLATFPAKLKIVGESCAGRGWNGAIGAGECARIFTGAPVPQGADRVVIQENVRRKGDIAVIEGPADASHIRKCGSDFEEGQELLPAGRLLDKRAIVAAAAADLAEVEVFKRPHVLILCTGYELAEPGTASERQDAIPDSVALGIAALVEEWGGEVIGRERLPDDLAAMEPAAARALADADLVVVTGGASVGEKDFAKAMFEPSGLELIFSKVNIKPGKPAWLGRVGSKLVVGLPGNPTSALVTGRLLVAPLLAEMSGRNPDEALNWRTANLANALAECGSRETFHRARCSDGQVEILGFQESHGQQALAEADVLVRQFANSPAMPTGAQIDVIDF